MTDDTNTLDELLDEIREEARAIAEQLGKTGAVADLLEETAVSAVRLLRGVAELADSVGDRKSLRADERARLRALGAIATDLPKSLSTLREAFSGGGLPAAAVPLSLGADTLSITAPAATGTDATPPSSAPRGLRWDGQRWVSAPV